MAAPGRFVAIPSDIMAHFQRLNLYPWHHRFTVKCVMAKCVFCQNQIPYMFTEDGEVNLLDAISFRQFGVSPPLSKAIPTEIELGLTEALQKSMQPFGVFETDAELNHRYADSLF